MIDVRNAAGLADGVHVPLQHIQDGLAALGLDLTLHVQAVDVQRQVAELVGDLFAFDDQRISRSAPCSAFSPVNVVRKL
jgi:hypothetical protein